MKTLAIISALILTAGVSVAHACDCNIPADRAKYPAQCGITTGNTVNGTQTQGQGQGQSQNAASNSRSNASGGSVGTVASQSVSAGGNAAATGGAGGTGIADSQASGGTGTGGNAESGASSNAQSTTYSAPRSPVNTALAAPGMTTAGCRFSDAVGVQTFGLGFSASKSRADSDCRKVEMANSLYARGLLWAGNKVTCTVSYVHDALGADCEALLLMPEPTARAAPAPSADVVTHAELSAAVGRAFKASVQK